MTHELIPQVTVTFHFHVQIQGVDSSALSGVLYFGILFDFFIKPLVGSYNPLDIVLYFFGLQQFQSRQSRCTSQWIGGIRMPVKKAFSNIITCLLYTSPSPRDGL